MKRIIIARHGNTFNLDEIPTRVGAKTDLPLVETHRGLSIGRYLKENNMLPQKIYSAPLLRTTQTAELAVEAMGLNMGITTLNAFTEIDYGIDENKTEEEIMFRLGKGNIEEGKAIIDNWNKNATVPQGWNVDVPQIIESWINFAKLVEKSEYDTVLLVTSNGIIRFAPYLTGNFESFVKNNNIKVSTGGICVFEKQNHAHWNCVIWNEKPYQKFN